MLTDLAKALREVDTKSGFHLELRAKLITRVKLWQTAQSLFNAEMVRMSLIEDLKEEFIDRQIYHYSIETNIRTLEPLHNNEVIVTAMYAYGPNGQNYLFEFNQKKEAEEFHRKLEHFKKTGETL